MSVSPANTIYRPVDGAKQRICKEANLCGTLLNEFLKEHNKVQELEANAARQQSKLKRLLRDCRK
jgi:hypothetical protein